jgi:ubiquinone/menaquinone biosynthesis C-methylase UbiE
VTTPAGQHGHAHRHDDSFDWDALVDSLELDAAIAIPIVDQVIDSWLSSALHVLDVGCGPGVFAVRIAQAEPRRSVTAIDSSEHLLDRVRRSAEAAGVGDRVVTLAGDLDHALPDTRTVDLIWASMVLHHVTDTGATLERLHDRLVPGGTLVMVEFGSAPTLLCPNGTSHVGDIWTRFEAATTAHLTEQLGRNPVTTDWPSALTEAGFVDIADNCLQTVHSAPLSPTVRAWLVTHIRSGIDRVSDRLDGRDVEVLRSLAEDAASSDELGVEVERRVLTARRG